MATNEDSKEQEINIPGAEQLAKAMMGLTKALTAREQTAATESLGNFRDISSSARKTLKKETGKEGSLEFQNSLVNQINKALRDGDKINRDAYDLAESRNLLLESDEDLEKKIKQQRQNQLDLAREADQLFRLSKQAESDGLTDLAKDLKQISVDLVNAKDATSGFETKLKDVQKEIGAIGNTGGVLFFESLAEATKNAPFLASAFKDASEASREYVRDAKSNQKILNKIYNPDDITKNAIEGERFEKGFGKGLTKEFFEDPENKEVRDLVSEATTAAGKKKGDMVYGPSAAEIIKDKADSLAPKKFDTLAKGAKAFGSSLQKALGPLTVITFLVKELIASFGLADKEVVEIQKSFAASREEAMGIRTELAGAADASGDFNITATKLLGTLTSISDQFGFIAKFSADTLVTATKLTEVVGISAEAAGQLAAASEATGTSLEQNYENVLGASYELQRQKGVQFDLRKILEATANVTGQVRANLGTNPELIAKAVTQAKLFGAEMSDIVASSRTLLSFEDSIRNELQAELLIGKDLNLERARSAALMGDMATVAKELTEQAGDYTDFSKLNVIQQDALASAIGMQSDQLSDILFKQEIQGKTAKDLRALGKGELADRLESQTAADKFSATMDKLKGIVTDVAVAFMPILEIVGMIAEAIGAIIKAVGPLKGILSGAALGFATGGPVGAAIGAIAGGVSDAVNYQNTSESPTFADDAMIPSSHQGGKTLLGPEGSIKFNKDDDIVAGTNLFGDRSLSQMPDYESVLAETKTKINPISTIDTTSAINTGMSSTVNNNQTQINQESEELLNQMKAMNAAINKQTEILAKGQNTIAQTKTKLQVGATDLGTQLNVNSFRIQ